MKKNIKIFGSIFSFVLVTIIIYSFGTSEKIEAAPTKKNNTSKNTVFVDIKGAVKTPGVYEVNSNSRIINVIEKAGGLKKDADTSIINLSKKVKDEMYIIIYTKDEVLSYKDNSSSSSIVKEIEENIVCPDTDNDGCITNNSSTSSVSSISSKININTASLEELTTLSGIGETKAKKIIEYREKNKFTKIEDITNVSGIGSSIYEKIKNNIEV